MTAVFPSLCLLGEALLTSPGDLETGARPGLKEEQGVPRPQSRSHLASGQVQLVLSHMYQESSSFTCSQSWFYSRSLLQRGC